jgi:hypothetical protein
MALTQVSQAMGGTGTSSVAASLTNTFGFKNRIINGDMRISQRFGTSSNNNSGYAYTLDRFVANSIPFNCAQNLNNITPPKGFTKYLGFQTSVPTALSAGSYPGVSQAIEGYNMADFGWGTTNAIPATLSFWVYSSVTGTWGGTIYDAAFNYTYVFTYSIPVANTWTYITLTIPAPTSGTFNTDNTQAAKIYWSMGCGSTYSGTATGAWQVGGYLGATGTVSISNTNNATFYITGVQFEAGTQATAFDFRDYGRELILCQRYCQVYGRTAYACIMVAQCYSTTQAYSAYQFVTPMRSAPTLSYSALSDWVLYTSVGSGRTLTSSSINYATTQNVEFIFAIGSADLVAGNATVLATQNTNATLTLSAEL